MKKLLLFLLFGHLAGISFAQSKGHIISAAQALKLKNSSAAYPTIKSKSSKELIALLDGQWRGFFDSNGDIVVNGTDNTEYVLELSIEGTKVSGYSYTYFQDRAYYVICSLSGELNATTKSLVINETARIKGVTPPGWSDCLQTHILTYKKEGTTEALTGSWRMAPGQIGDCGFGSTTLTRRTLSTSLSSYNKASNSAPFSTSKPAKQTQLAEHNKPKTPLVKNLPKPETPVIEPTLPASPVIKETPENIQPAMTQKQPEQVMVSDINFEKRNNNLLQTIKIMNESIRIDLYDNGVIDGDSISLFFNGKLILSHQRLSEKAISLTLNINTNRQVNDLTMYAENLGEIPPNTALMVVTDGEARYEVPVTSDLKNNGTVRFLFAGKDNK